MGLASQPDTMAKAIAAQGRGPDAKPRVPVNTVRRHVADTSPAQLRILRHGLSDQTGGLFRWMLDIGELSARDERVWKLQRRMLLDMWAEFEKKQRAFLNSVYGLSPDQVQAMLLTGQEIARNNPRENYDGA